MTTPPSSSSWRETPYEVLGVARTCDQAELKRTYNALLKKVHPDKGGDEARFRRVQKAYRSVLRDVAKLSAGGGAGAGATASGARAPRPREGWTPAGVRDGAANDLAKPTYFATQAKLRGNESFAARDFAGAVASYTEALEWLPGEAALHCNRSAAWFELGEAEKALRDAVAAASASPRYVKAHYRCALAYSTLGNHVAAVARMRKALELSLSSEECGRALARIEEACARDFLALNLVGHGDTVQDVSWRPPPPLPPQHRVDSPPSSPSPPEKSARPVLATASLDGTVRLWCGDSGILLHVLRGHEDKVTDLLWSRDGAYLVSLSLDQTARVWRVAVEGSAACVRILSGHSGRATAAAIFLEAARDRDPGGGPGGGHLLATSSTDCTARIWRPFDGPASPASPAAAEVGVLAGHRQMVTCLDFCSRLGKLATASADNTFRLWERHGGRGEGGFACTQEVDWGSGAVNKCLFVAVGEKDLLVTSHFDVKFERSRVLVWDMGGAAGWADGKLVAHAMHFEGFGGKVTCLDAAAFAEDGSVLLAAGCSDGTVRVFDLASKGDVMFDLVDEHLPAVGSASPSISALAFSPDGSKLATSGLDGRIHLWRSDDGTHVMTFNGHRDRICSLSWNREGTKLASCGWDKSAKVWKTGAL